VPNRSNFRRIHQSSRRKTEWFASGDISAASVLPFASFTLDQSLAAGGLAKRPFTVTRTIGSIWVSSDQVAGEEQPFGALGFQVVSGKAVATGVTALPDPITEEESDNWFVYKAFASSGGPIEGQPMREFAFDSKAQRIVEDGNNIAVMVSNAHASAGLRYILKFRMLVKLS